jgi:hypothetical protein
MFPESVAGCHGYYMPEAGFLLFRNQRGCRVLFCLAR